MSELFYDEINKITIENTDFTNTVKQIMNIPSDSELSISIDDILNDPDKDNNIVVKLTVIGSKISYLFEVIIDLKENSYQIVSNEDITEQDIRASKLSYDIDYWSYNITYNQLAQMYHDEIIKVPEMQRGFVWNRVQASRLIESIVMGLPLPSIFLVAIEENGRKRYLVIDGLQRITTIHAYIYNERLPIQNNVAAGFSLKGVNDKYENMNFIDLEKEGLADNLKYNTINVIEFKQNLPYNESAMYSIFERLNSGGTTLSSQQIRNSIFYGYFNKSLNDFATQSLAKYFSNSAVLNLSNSEILLRAIAIYDLVNESGDITDFSITGSIVYKTLLNDVAEKYHIEYKKCERKNSIPQFQSNIDELFNKIKSGIEIIEELLGVNAFKKYDTTQNKYNSRITPIIFEAIIVSYLLGYSNRVVVKEDFQDRYNRLFIDGDFEKYFTQGTGQKENIKNRIVAMNKVLYGE